MHLMFHGRVKLITGSVLLTNNFLVYFSSKHMLTFLYNFKEKKNNSKNSEYKFKKSQEKHNFQLQRHPLSFSYSFSILIMCQMLIWLTAPCIQPFCNFNQVIKRAVISLVHLFTDHCNTLVIDKWVPVVFSKNCVVVSTFILKICHF